MLESDTLEVLRLVQSVKNTFVSINWIPPEILSLIPDYLNNEGADLVTLTHVCRSWRDIFTSRSSLWASLNCTNVRKTLAYIERSKSIPLDICLDDGSYHNDALLLVAPHIDRLGSLTIRGSVNIIPDLIKHFSHPAPLLWKLEVGLDVYRTHHLVFPTTLFNGDLSSLRELSLAGAIQLPWRNLSSLGVFKHYQPASANPPSTAQLLDLLESAPLLRDIELHHPASTPQNAPSGRVVPLPLLEILNLNSPTAHTALLKHLSIPTGASLALDYYFSEDEPLTLDYLPEDINNLNNLPHITSVSLYLGMVQHRARFDGPSGRLYLRGSWGSGDPLYVVRSQIFRTLRKLNLSSAQRLVVTKYTTSLGKRVEKSPIFQTLLLMNGIHTLTLIKCNNLSFIRALNPENNDAGTVACPNLEELVLYIKRLDWLHASELKEMASARSGRHAKLPSITIIGLGKVLPEEEVSALRAHFPCVKYEADVESPEWGTFPGDAGPNDDEGDWWVSRLLVGN